MQHDDPKTSRPPSSRGSRPFHAVLRDRLLARLPAASLPFAARSLRGPRFQRTFAGSLLLAAISLVVGVWMTLGSGSFERGIRQQFGLEAGSWERGRVEYTVFTDTDVTEAELAEYAEAGAPPDYASLHGDTLWRDIDRYNSLQTEPIPVLLAMANSPRGQGDAALRRSAQIFIEQHPDLFSEQRVNTALGVQVDEMGEPIPHALDSYREDFVWEQPERLAMAELAMARTFQPHVERYRSPLDLRHAIAVVGLCAGGLFTLLMLVVAPVAIGAQQAQERHENTLMPLTATSLSAREVVLGLASGPGLVVSMVAAPQLLLALVAAACFGSVVVSVLFGAALTLLAAVPLCLIGQMLGQLAGRRHAPGLVTFGLLAVFAPLWFLGLSLANTLDPGMGDPELRRLMALVPTAGPIAWLERGFVSAVWSGNELEGSSAWWLGAGLHGLAAPVVGALLGLGLAALLLRALERHVTAAPGPSLTRRESHVGAGLLVGLMCYAVPFDFGKFEPYRSGIRPDEFYLATLALAVVPLGVLVMARVPLGDSPGMRKVPLRQILLDVSGWFGAHLMLVTAMGLAFHHELIGAWHPYALLYLAWSVVTLTLLATRAVAFPLGVAGVAFGMFSALTGIMAFVHIGAFASGNGDDLVHPLGLVELSPVLGLLQLIVLVGVPLALWRRLRSQCTLE